MPQRLGQHFLKNIDKIELVANSLNIRNGDIVIEIGGGHGELTKKLLTRDIKLVVIEKDPVLAKQLSSLSGTDFIVVTEDARSALLEIVLSLRNAPYKIIGNIPYYLTNYLFRLISELPKLPNAVVVTIQKEVAERIIATPPHMNLLAASIQAWTEPKLIDYIPASDFFPKPKIDSAILSLETKSLPPSKIFYEFLKYLFRQPRKTILNNLVPHFGSREHVEAVLRKLSIDPNARPQHLSLEQIKRLFNAL